MEKKVYVPWWIMHESEITVKIIRMWYHVALVAINLGIIIACGCSLLPKGAIFASIGATFALTTIGIMTFTSVDNPYKWPFAVVIIGTLRFNKFLTNIPLGPDREFLISIAKLYRFDLRKIPKDYLTKEFAKGLIEIEPVNIIHTPFEELKTKEAVKKAVTKEPAIFSGLSKDLKTEELAIIAVKYNPKLLQYVDNQTPAIICAAIQHSTEDNRIDPDHIKHKDVASASRKESIRDLFKEALGE